MKDLTIAAEVVSSQVMEEKVWKVAFVVLRFVVVVVEMLSAMEKLEEPEELEEPGELEELEKLEELEAYFEGFLVDAMVEPQQPAPAWDPLTWQGVTS